MTALEASSFLFGSLKTVNVCDRHCRRDLQSFSLQKLLYKMTMDASDRWPDAVFEHKVKGWFFLNVHKISTSHLVLNVTTSHFSTLMN